MSEILDSGLPPNPRWWSALDDADPQRQPQRPSLIFRGELYAYADLTELARILAELLDGRAPVLVRSVATFHGFDTFPAFSLSAQAQGADGQAPAATYVGCVAVQKTTAAQLEAAIAAAAAAGGEKAA